MSKEADKGAAAIMGDNGQAFINFMSQAVTDIMNYYDYTADDANADLSDAVYGTPWGRANQLCPTCKIPENLLGSTLYDIGNDETIEDGKEVAIPVGDNTVDGQLPSTLNNLDGEFNEVTQGVWNGTDYFSDGGGWHDAGSGCDGLVYDNKFKNGC